MILVQNMTISDIQSDWAISARKLHFSKKKVKQSEIFARNGMWDSLFYVQVCTSEHKLPQNRALKWAIVWFSSIFDSLTISLQGRKEWKILIKIWQNHAWWQGSKKIGLPMRHGNSWSINYHCVVLRLFLFIAYQYSETYKT